MSNDPRVRLLGLRDTPLSVDEALAAVADPGAGGIAVFLGTVRDDDEGRAVTELGYSAHPTAEERMRQVVVRAADAHDLIAVAALHRVGDLGIGEIAVVVAAAAAHRAEALAGCRQLIDDIKAEVPLWKHQRFADGAQEWVGLDS